MASTTTVATRTAFHDQKRPTQQGAPFLSPSQADLHRARRLTCSHAIADCSMQELLLRRPQAALNLLWTRCLRASPTQLATRLIEIDFYRRRLRPNRAAYIRYSSSFRIWIRALKMACRWLTSEISADLSQPKCGLTIGHRPYRN